MCTQVLQGAESASKCGFPAADATGVCRIYILNDCVFVLSSCGKCLQQHLQRNCHPPVHHARHN